MGQDEREQAATGYKWTAINFPGASATFAYAINDGGEIVGYYTGGGCSQSSCGFTLVKGTYTTVECALENGTDLFDISNKGGVVGAYSYYGGVNGFIWQGNSSCFDLVDPDEYTLTEGWGVNDGGTVVGFYEDSSGNFQGFEYGNSGYTNIACSGWTNTRAYGINDAGLIVGDNANSPSGPFSGFLYKSGGCSAVDFPKATSTSAKGINKSGQISGWYTNAKGTRGFVKTGSSFTTLNYPKSAGTLAFHMNDSGQVAGWYKDASGAYHGFVATPK
jgi:hypothetical protein